MTENSWPLHILTKWEWLSSRCHGQIFQTKKTIDFHWKGKESPRISWKSDRMLLTEPAGLQEMILKFSTLICLCFVLLLATGLSSKGDSAVQREAEGGMLYSWFII